jgi:hypothetical protein
MTSAIGVDPETGAFTADGFAETMETLETAVNDPTTGLTAKVGSTEFTNLQTWIGVDDAGNPTAGGTAEDLDQLFFELADPASDTSSFGMITQISTIQGDLDDIQAEWGVQIVTGDPGGQVISGISLLNGTDSSTFQVLADNFVVWDPGPGYLDANGDVLDPSDKFMVIGYSGGQLGIDGAYMKTATIDDAAIANLSAAKLTAGQLTSGTWIKGGDFFGGQLRLGVGTIVRDDETGSPAGYASVIDSDGRAWLEDAYVRGDVEASSIRGGKTGANDTTPGYFLGFDGSTPEVNIGNSSNKLHWNGSSLVVRGDIEATSLTADTVNTDKLVTGAINVSGAWAMSGSSQNYNFTNYSYHTKTGLDSLGALGNGARVIIFHELSGQRVQVTLEVRAYSYGTSWSEYTQISTESFSGASSSYAQIGAVYDLPNNATQVQFRMSVTGNDLPHLTGTGSSSGDYVVIKK